MARVRALAHLLEGLAPGQVGEVSDKRAEHLAATGAAERVDAPETPPAKREPKAKKK